MATILLLEIILRCEEWCPCALVPGVRSHRTRELHGRAQLVVGARARRRVRREEQIAGQHERLASEHEQTLARGHVVRA